MNPIRKYYRQGDLTVLWQPALCKHSGICFRGLPRVFDPKRRPWIVLDDADEESVVMQVERCPSGALSIVPPLAAAPADDES